MIRTFRPRAFLLPGASPCLSYAAVPLFSSDEHMIGTMAVLSQKADQFKPEHLTLLEILGRQAVTRLELYNRIRLQEQAQRQRQRTERALGHRALFCGRDAGLDSRAGDGAGYRGARGAHELSLRAIDRIEPGACRGAAVCG